MSIEETKNQLEAATITLGTAPFGRLVDGLANSSTAQAEAYILSGVKILLDIEQRLPPYVQDAYAIKENADDSGQQIRTIATTAGEMPNENIAIALLATTIMSKGTEVAGTAIGTMREALSEALGHIAAFTETMERYNVAWDTAVNNVNDGWQGQQTAISLIDTYVEQVG